MSDVVLRVAGRKVAYGGPSAVRSAHRGAGNAPSPTLPHEGEGTAQRGRVL
jgi:hypothetical protein